MAHPIIELLTRYGEVTAKAAVAAGATYRVNPRATAVLLVFRAKLRSDPEVADVPLEDVVTPSSLEHWRETFDDPKRLESPSPSVQRACVRTRPRPRSRHGIGLLLRIPASIPRTSSRQRPPET